MHDGILAERNAPVGHDAVLDGVLEGEDTALGLGLVTDVGILLAHADHHTLVAGATDDGGEDGAGRIITSKASLAHARAVVNNESLNLLVRHSNNSEGCLERTDPELGPEQARLKRVKTVFAEFRSLFWLKNDWLSGHNFIPRLFSCYCRFENKSAIAQ